MRLLMGNTHVPVHERDRETDEVVTSYVEASDGGTVTVVAIPDGVSLLEAFQSVTLPGGVGDVHFVDAPEWVSSDVSGLAELVGAHYGCEVREHETREG